MSLPGNLRYPDRCPGGDCSLFWELAPETLRR
jgi:hypothetical protein